MEGSRIHRRAAAGPGQGRRKAVPTLRVGATALLALTLGGGALPARAQNPIEGYDWSARTLRPSGQPIIPAFEGWYQEPDGSYRLCFGYWSGNIEAEVDVPLGPDNFIEPAEFDGVQPTHFMPVPRTGYRKHYCVFTVRIPEDYAGRDVVWTLRLHGNEFSVPGRVTAPAYMLDEPDSNSRAAAWGFLAEEEGIESYDEITEADLPTWLDFNPGQAQGSIAPLLRWIEPAGAEGRGRAGVRTGPVTVAAGEPLTLSIFVDEPDGRPARWWVGWAKFSGPGDVRFSQLEMLADYRYENRATTTATFSEPGEYVVLVQSIENIQSFERQCCWTNGYVEVSVTP